MPTSVTTKEHMTATYHWLKLINSEFKGSDLPSYASHG